MKKKKSVKGRVKDALGLGKGKKGSIEKSAKDGRFVSKSYAEKNPETTFREEIERKEPLPHPEHTMPLEEHHEVVKT